MNNKSIIKSCIWLLLVFGVLLIIATQFISTQELSNIILGLGTGVITSFIVAIIIEYRHEKQTRKINQNHRKDFFLSISYLIKDIIFTFRSWKFECNNLNCIEYIDLLLAQIDDKNSPIINHTTKWMLETELSIQNINTRILHIMNIIDTKEFENINKLIFHIRDLREPEYYLFYAHLKMLYQTLQIDILKMPEFSDFLYLKFSYTSGDLYTGISISDNCPNKEIILSSDIFEPLFR